MAGTESPLIWRDGARLRDRSIDPRERSWGVFTTVGCDQGRLLLWSAHRSRLEHSARFLGAPESLELPADQELERLLADNGLLGPARMRALVYRDDFGTEGPHRRWIVEAAASAAPGSGPSAPPLSLAVVRWPGPPPLAGHKTLARLAWDLAAARARALGADDALIVCSDGLVLETSTGTIWARKGNRLLTPRAPEHCLPGVLRAWLLESLPQRGLRAEVADLDLGLDLDQLLQADEVWVSSSVAGLRRVARVDTVCWSAWPAFEEIQRAGLPAPGWSPPTDRRPGRNGQCRDDHGAIS